MYLIFQLLYFHLPLLLMVVNTVHITIIVVSVIKTVGRDQVGLLPAALGGWGLHSRL